MKISFYLPETKLTNDTLEKEYNDPKWKASKIFRKTGIQNRYVAKEELVSDLAVKAGNQFFDEYNFVRNDLEFLLLCTQSPDYFLPTTACLVQHQLRLPESVGAVDFNLGCSGYIYGLAVAKGLCDSATISNCLLLTSETYSKHIHPLDKSSRTIFGDGATATLVNKDLCRKIGKFVFGTDGSGGKNLIVPAGGMAEPHTVETATEEVDKAGNIRSKNHLYMNGPEIFSFTLRTVPNLIEKTLSKNNLQKNQVDLYVFHQANRFILETLRDKLEIPEDKFYMDVEDTGNTVSSSIPIALKRAMDKGIIAKDMTVCIAGFGVGYSWGATVLKI